MRILLLEDNEDLMSVMEYQLELEFRKQGKQIREFYKAASLRELKDQMAAGLTVDCAILDYNLPDGLSTSVVPLLREKLPEARIFVWTGTPRLEDVDKTGVDLVVHKNEPGAIVDILVQLA